MSFESNVSRLLDIETTTPTPSPKALTTTEPEERQVIVSEEGITEEELDKEYVEGELRLKRTLEIGEQALNRMSEIADQDERSRSYEIVAKLMETVSKVQTELLDVTERRAGLKKTYEEPEPEGPDTINNTIIINGTTAEIQATLQELRESKRQDVFRQQ